MAREEKNYRRRSDREEDDAETPAKRLPHSELGKFRREFLHKESRIYPWFQSGCSVLGILVSTILIVAVQATCVRVVLAVVALGALIMGAALLYDLVRGHTQVVRILLHKNGFVYRDGPTTVCPWADVAELRNIVPGVRTNNPGVRLHDGTEFVFNPMIADLQIFLTILVDSVSTILMEEIRDTLDRGQRVAFGQRLKLSSDGLVVDKNFYRWEEIDHLRLRTTKRTKNAEAANDPALAQMGAFGYLMQKAASQEKRTTRLQVLLRDGEREEIGQNDLANLPLLLDLLHSRYQLEIQWS